MRRWIGRIIIALAVGLAAAQAVRPSRTNPPAAGPIHAPADVVSILRRACFDCHSSETIWPWYSQVAPLSWLIAHDVGEGRAELDYSAWTTYSPAKLRKKLEETAKEVAEGEMPPWYYVLMHPEARLGDGDKERLRAWGVEEAGRLGG